MMHSAATLDGMESNAASTRWVVGAVARAALVVLAILVAVWLVVTLRGLLLLVGLAIVLASAVIEPVDALERRGLPSPLAIAAVYGVVLVVVLLLGLLVIPPLIGQLEVLVGNLPAIVEQARQRLEALLEGFADIGIAAPATDVVRRWLTSMRPGSLVGIPFAIAEAVANVLLVLVLSAMIVFDRRKIRSWVTQFLAPDDREQADELAQGAVSKLGAYARAQLLVMTFIGFGAYAGMIVLGVPFAIPLGVLAFLTEMIPFIGPYIAGVPIVVLAALQDPLTGLMMAIWLLVLQQIEGYVLVPIVQGRALSLSPLVVTIAVLVGASLAGLVGALLSVPATAVIDLVIRQVILPWRRRGTDSHAPPMIQRRSRLTRRYD